MSVNREAIFNRHDAKNAKARKEKAKAEEKAFAVAFSFVFSSCLGALGVLVV